MPYSWSLCDLNCLCLASTFKVLISWRCYARIQEPRTEVPVLPQLGPVFQAEPCGSSPLAAVNIVFRCLPLFKNLEARMMNYGIMLILLCAHVARRCLNVYWFRLCLSRDLPSSVSGAGRCGVSVTWFEAPQECP